MSRTQNYITPAELMEPINVLAAGCTGTPEVIAAGGVLSSAATITFTGALVTGDTITFGGVTLTAVAASPNYLQFVQGALASVLPVLVTQFQGLSTPVAGTYSTNGTTTLTFTPTAYGPTGIGYAYNSVQTMSAVKSSGGTNTASQSGGVSQNLFSTNFAIGDSVTIGANTVTASASASPSTFVPSGTLANSLALLQQVFANLIPLTTGQVSVSAAGTALVFTPATQYSATAYTVASNHSTVALTQSTNLGAVQPVVSMDTEHTQINGVAASSVILVPNGIESQKKTIANLGANTAIVKFTTNPTGVTNQSSMPANSIMILQWLASKWRLVLNDGCTLS